MIVAFLFLSCTPAPECVDLGDCASLEVCDLGTCLSVECHTSDDCGIDQYCGDTNYTCEPGCGTDDDCLAGETCDDAHACTPYGCRSTALDCAVGQQCDLTTGVCADAPTCESCTDTAGAECGLGACVDFTLDEPEGTYCIMPCLVVDDPEQCPRGLECRDLSGLGDLYCYAHCPSLVVELEP